MPSYIAAQEVGLPLQHSAQCESLCGGVDVVVDDDAVDDDPPGIVGRSEMTVLGKRWVLSFEDATATTLIKPFNITRMQRNTIQISKDVFE